MAEVQKAIIALFGSIFLLSLSLNELKAEVFNKVRVFESVAVCDDYSKFLIETNGITGVDCHPIARFLIENDTKDISSFLTKMQSMSVDSSTLGALVAIMQSILYFSPAEEIYSTAEIAGRKIAIKMALSRDVERAVLYSHLISEIQRVAIKEMCTGSGNCKKIESISSVGELLGKKYFWLDGFRADIPLLCLLKVDGYIVPIRDVLASEKYRSCLKYIVGKF